MFLEGQNTTLFQGGVAPAHPLQIFGNPLVATCARAV